MNEYRQLQFWTRVSGEGEEECWTWLGALQGGGYGQFNNPGGSRLAHRIAYELLVGPIPEAHVLRHRVTCPKHCVNPAHVTPITWQEHTQQLHERELNATWTPAITDERFAEIETEIDQQLNKRVRNR